MNYVILCLRKVIELKAAIPLILFGGCHSPPDERKEGDSNDYISGFIYVLYVHCCPYQSAFSDI